MSDLILPLKGEYFDAIRARKMVRRACDLHPEACDHIIELTVKTVLNRLEDNHDR